MSDRSGIGLSCAFSDALVRDRYAVHAMPIVETKGWRRTLGQQHCPQTTNPQTPGVLTSWNCTGINRKLTTCTAGHST